MKKVLAILIALVLVATLFTACSNKSGGQNTTTPLVVGYSNFSEKFSPFFSETAYDQDVWKMTSVDLLGIDRQGAVVEKGINVEKIPYNNTEYTYPGMSDLTITTNDDGTVYYDFVLRDGVKFSDGEALTIDDVIFSMYVLSDPTYDGSSTFFALPIEGMEEYRSGMDSRINLILADGPDGYKETEYYTEDQYTAFWDAFDKAGVAFVEGIHQYLLDNGYNKEEDTADVWSANWGYAAKDEADMWEQIKAAYGYDISDDGINCEKGNVTISEALEAELGDKWEDYKTGVQTGESAANVTGIQKTGDNSLRVVLKEVDAAAIYQLGITIAPLHYYGDTAKFDYDNNKFGFDKGDLSAVRAKTTQPLGAGPYKFVKYENGVVSFEANDDYFLGTPKTKYLQFKETSDQDKLNGVITGSIDLTDPSFSKDTAKSISEANSNGEVTGDKITTNTVDNLGYGYIGISAKAVKVGDDIASDASKNLRKAFATVYAVYRDVAIDSYYGEAASIINYPISNTSWAAPQKTDADYAVAFSKDVEGNDIYTSDMSAEDKYDAAIKAALGYFEAAGYTVKDGKVTAAPEGAKTEYEVWIPADGTGDHPSFMILKQASDAFKKIGITLNVKDLANSADLWTGIESDQVPMWCAAWGATPDPDMYQVYYSGVESGKDPGGSNYMYDIADAELDELILTARGSLDKAFRKTTYKACLDIIVDWAVEVPVYQRQNAIIFSTERVVIDSVTPDITTYYNWYAEIQNIQVNETASTDAPSE